MRSRLLSLLVALLLFPACAVGGTGGETGRALPAGGPPPSGEPAPGHPPAEDRPPDPPGDATYDYVLRLIEVDRSLPSAPELVSGFDLDGHTTAMASDPIGCGEMDFSAPTRFGGHDGVDNQLSRLLDTAEELDPELDVNHSLGASVRSGNALLLVRLQGVGDLVDDGAVEVLLYVGELAGLGPPVLEDARWDGETHAVLAGGQRFTIHPDSVVDGDPARPVVAFRDAWIRSGRLVTMPLDVRLDIALDGGRTLPLDLGGARLAFDVDAAAIGSGLLGGHLGIDALVAAVASLVDTLPVPEATIATILEGMADIDSDPASPGCDALSLALAFEGVEAAIE